MPVTIASGPARRKAACTSWSTVGTPVKEHDDSRKYPLPRTAFQTAPVDRPLGVPKSDQFAHSRDPEREIPTKTRGAAKNVGVHDDDRG